MTTPFFRGSNRIDWLTCALLAGAQIYDNEELTKYLLDGVETADVQVYRGQSGSLPGWILHVSPHYVFIGVQGTTGPFPFGPQWLGNLLGSVQSTNPPFAGGTHTYFATAAHALFTDLLPRVTPYLDKRLFVFIGHSLGGAIAQLLASVIAPNVGMGSAVFSLAAPRVGDSTFSASVANCRLLQNFLDVVPGLPPAVWAASADTFPIPGPPPLAHYTHAGTVYSLDLAGNIAQGDNSPGVDEILQLLLAKQFSNHFSQEYARRLSVPLTPADFTPEATGYVDPQRLLLTFDSVAAPKASPPSTEGGTMFKVTMFFSLNGKGFTDSYYTGQTDPVQRDGDLKFYLNLRLAIACPQVRFLYARISNLDVKRRVDWATDVTLGINPNGTFAANVAQEDDALLVRGQTIGRSSDFRMFLHGYPESLVQNEVLVITGTSWNTKFIQFKNGIIGNGSAYQFKSINESAKPDPIGISTATPLPSRGYTIVPSVATPITKGNTVYVQKAGHKQVGYNGRKVVTFVAAGNAHFDVGGAVPVGDLDAGAEFIILPFQFVGAQYMAIERYTEHRLGKVFGVRPGRNQSTLPLRR